VTSRLMSGCGATALAVALLLLPGCASSPTASRVAATVEDQLPGCHLQRESRLALGPLSLAVVRGIVRLVGEDVDEEARAVLSGLRRVEVVTYVVEGRHELGPASGRLRIDAAFPGWSLAVRTREEMEHTWLLVRDNDRGEMRGLAVVVLDGSELEVVVLRGRLDRVLADQLAADPAELLRAVDSSV